MTLYTYLQIQSNHCLQLFLSEVQSPSNTFLLEVICPVFPVVFEQCSCVSWVTEQEDDHIKGSYLRTHLSTSCFLEDNCPFLVITE